MMLLNTDIRRIYTLENTECVLTDIRRIYTLENTEGALKTNNPEKLAT